MTKTSGVGRSTLGAAAVALATLALAGCGGSGGTASPGTAAAEGGGGSPATTTAASAAPVGDVCTSLSAEQVSATLGYQATSQGESAGSEAYGLSYCTWGTPDQGAMLALQVFTPGAVQDPLALLFGGIPGGSTPVSGLPEGKQYAAGAMPGGGGVGTTVTWVEDGHQYALALVGSDITEAQKQALVTTAQAVVNS